MTRELLVQNIKDCGQSLIDNAEKIANYYDFMIGLNISCYVDEEDRSPYISVNTDFVPESFVKRIT